MQLPRLLHPVLLIALSIASLAALFSCSRCTPAPNPKPIPEAPTDSSAAPNPKEEPRGKTAEDAATMGIEILKRISGNTQSMSVGGFRSIEEVAKAKLGSPLQTIWLNCGLIDPAKQKSPILENIKRIQTTYPVVVDNELRSLIQIDSVQPSDSRKAENMPWYVRSMGDASVIKLFNDADKFFPNKDRNRSKDVLVYFVGGPIYFRASGINDTDYAMPLVEPNLFQCLPNMKTAMTWTELRIGIARCDNFAQLCKMGSAIMPDDSVLQRTNKVPDTTEMNTRSK